MTSFRFEIDTEDEEDPMFMIYDKDEGDDEEESYSWYREFDLDQIKQAMKDFLVKYAETELRTWR